MNVIVISKDKLFLQQLQSYQGEKVGKVLLVDTNRLFLEEIFEKLNSFE
jgi:hypothetical protein